MRKQAIRAGAVALALALTFSLMLPYGFADTLPADSGTETTTIAITTEPTEEEISLEEVGSEEEIVVTIPSVDADTESPVAPDIDSEPPATPEVDVESFPVADNTIVPLAAPDSSAKINAATGRIGGEIKVTAAITAPSDTDIYGFTSSVQFPANTSGYSGALTMVGSALDADNPKVTFVEVPYSMGSIRSWTVSAESDGETVLIPKGESFELTLTFNVPISQPAPYSIAFGSTTLITEPELENVNVFTLSAGIMTTTTEGVPHPFIGGTYWLQVADDVLWFADEVSGGNNKIGAWVKEDIDLRGTDFAGIGTVEYPYLGTFSGTAGKTVTYERVSTGDNVGFFGVLGDGTTVVTVRNFNVAGTINSASGNNIGGIAGSANRTAFDTCSSDVTITASGNNVGGIVGSLTGAFSVGYPTAAFYRNVNSGDVSGGICVGGLIGTLTASTVGAENSYSVGGNSASIIGRDKVGGFIGSSDASTLFFAASGTSPANSGDVTAATGIAGGILGVSQDTIIINATNAGDVTGTVAGGIAGEASGDSGSITNSWNKGVIRSNAAANSAAAAAGGIVGKSSSDALTLGNNASLGTITANTGVSAGGVLGAKDSALSGDSGFNYYVATGASADAAGARAVVEEELVLADNKYSYVPEDSVVVKKSDPVRLAYFTGQPFDSTGFNVVVFGGGTEMPIPADKIKISKVAALAESDTLITITVSPVGLDPVAFEYPVTVITPPLPTISAATGDIGTDIPVTITMYAPDVPVYGFFAYIGSDSRLSLDVEKFATDNPRIILDTSNPYAGPAVSFGGGDGTILIPANGSFELKLTFKASIAIPGNLNITFSTQGYRSYMVTDPSLPATLTSLNTPETLNRGKAFILPNATGSVTTTANFPHPLIGDSYYLQNVDDVLWFADEVNGGNSAIKAQLATDIDLTGTTFDGIGTAGHPFLGTFNGNNHIVTYAIDSDHDNTGLFGVVGDGEATPSVGALRVAGSITSSGNNVGGVAGTVNVARLTGCVSDVIITATGTNVGGIAGLFKDAPAYSFYDNANRGAVRGGVNVGGIAGSFINSSTQSYNTGFNTGAITGQDKVGGLFGFVDESVVNFSRNGTALSTPEGWVQYQPPAYPANSGEIVATSGTAGAVVGVAHNSTITNASNSGEVSGVIAGGSVGQVTGDIGSVTISWNHGAITSTAPANSTTGAAGGIVGSNTAEALTLSGSANLGAIMAASGVAAGGVLGFTTKELAEGSTLNYYVNETASSDAAGASAVALENLTLVQNRYTYTPSFSGAGDPTRGDGTAENPYGLVVADDIIWLAGQVNGGNAGLCAILMNDIDLSEVSLADFSGIGLGGGGQAVAFGGTFDGDGYSITLSMNAASGSYQSLALFSSCNGATIKNLTIKGSVSTQAGSAAGLAGLALNSRVENCHNEASITSWQSDAAGLVASASSTTLIGCSNSGVVQNAGGSSMSSVGGIVASINGDTVIENCLNSAAIRGGGRIGGIAGSASVTVDTQTNTPTSVIIRGSQNTGSVTATTPTALATVNVANGAGGILGYAAGSYVGNNGVRGIVTIDGVSNSGTISGTSNNLGGIFGQLGGNYTCWLAIMNATNSGDVISTYDGPSGDHGGSYVSAGGIAGDAGHMWSDAIDPVTGERKPAASTTLTGNKNTGNVSANGNATSSILGRGDTVVVSGNTSTVLVGNDLNNPNVIYVGPPIGSSDPDPRPSNPPSNTTPGGSLVPVSPVDTAVETTDTSSIDNRPSIGQPAPTRDTSDSGANTPITEPTTPEAAELAPARAPTFFEIVVETVQNNPVIVVLLIIAAGVLAMLGGLWRYRKTRRE
jgi:hypothetical protein